MLLLGLLLGCSSPPDRFSDTWSLCADGRDEACDEALLADFGGEEGTEALLDGLWELLRVSSDLEQPLEEAETLCERIAIIDRGHIVEVATKKALLNKLHQETFLLDVSRPVSEPWESRYALRIIDDTTLEVDVTKDQGINGVFAELSYLPTCTPHYEPIHAW